MNTVRFVVLGHPEPAGSKRAFVVAGRARVTDANSKSRNWKTQVSERAFEVMQDQELFTGPLELTLVFYRKRPQGHYGSGKNASTLKASAAAYPTSKPDCLKLARGVEDALTSIVYRDDAQIVHEHIFKQYGLPERVEITVRALPETYSNGRTTPQTPPEDPSPHRRGGSVDQARDAARERGAG